MVNIIRHPRVRDKVNIVKPRRRPRLAPPELLQLLHERTRIVNSKPIALSGCWLETTRKGKDKNFVQLFWRSRHPIFNGRTTRYIRKKDHAIARESVRNRNALQSIDYRIKMLEKKD